MQIRHLKMCGWSCCQPASSPLLATELLPIPVGYVEMCFSLLESSLICPPSLLSKSEFWSSQMSVHWPTCGLRWSCSALGWQILCTKGVSGNFCHWNLGFSAFMLAFKDVKKRCLKNHFTVKFQVLLMEGRSEVWWTRPPQCCNMGAGRGGGKGAFLATSSSRMTQAFKLPERNNDLKQISLRQTSKIENVAQTGAA